MIKNVHCRRFYTWGSIVIVSLALVACGKKPNFVDAPQGRKNDQFPHSYPRPTEKPIVPVMKKPVSNTDSDVEEQK